MLRAVTFFLSCIVVHGLWAVRSNPTAYNLPCVSTPFFIFFAFPLPHRLFPPPPRPCFACKPCPPPPPSVAMTAPPSSLPPTPLGRPHCHQLYGCHPQHRLPLPFFLMFFLATFRDHQPPPPDHPSPEREELAKKIGGNTIVDCYIFLFYIYFIKTSLILLISAKRIVKKMQPRALLIIIIIFLTPQI